MLFHLIVMIALWNVTVLALQTRKLKLKVAKWFAQISTAMSGLDSIQIQVFFKLQARSSFSLYHRCSKNFANQRSLIQLTIGGKAVLNLGKILYISRDKRFSNWSLCQQNLTSEGFLFSIILDVMSTGSLISDCK